MLFLWQVEFVLGGTSGCGRNKAIWLLNLLLLVLVNRIYDLFDASECQLALVIDRSDTGGLLRQVAEATRLIPIDRGSLIGRS